MAHVPCPKTELKQLTITPCTSQKHKQTQTQKWKKKTQQNKGNDRMSTQ